MLRHIKFWYASKTNAILNHRLNLEEGPMQRKQNGLEIKDSNMKNQCSPSAIKSLMHDLGSKDGRTRVRARKQIVKIGHPVIPQLIGLLQSPAQTIRWEAAKALEQIGDPAAVDALVAALRDSVFDVQWLAAEALINIGSDSIRPLLKELIEHPRSDEIRVGVHHVFHNLKDRDYDDILKPVVESLEDTSTNLQVPLEARKALELIPE
jgi:HEAT repeat protein